MRSILIFSMVLCMVTACKENGRYTPKRETNTQIGGYDEPAEETESLTKQEITDFMERWVRVYNTHTYDTYLRMYDARNFVGVKRPLDGKKNTYNYAGWADNKRSEFRKFKPEVYMNNLKITSLNRDGRSKVSFEQIWVSYSANYADKGEKIMTLKKVNGDIKIEYEELLYSERADEYLDGYDY